MTTLLTLADVAPPPQSSSVPGIAVLVLAVLVVVAVAVVVVVAGRNRRRWSGPARFAAANLQVSGDGGTSAGSALGCNPVVAVGAWRTR